MGDTVVGQIEESGGSIGARGNKPDLVAPDSLMNA